MITVKNEIVKKQPNFWNACIFHPTDAVEDAWGRRIIDKMADDKSIHTIRIYAMLEDIVYLDEDNNLCYDFRVSDLRLDYLVEKGFNLLIAYAGIPECIASSNDMKTSVSKNKTRYKGKMWNAAPPKDYGLWEEICYEYTKHNIERYGIEKVSKWYCHCFNEADISCFFLSNLPNTAVNERLTEYCKLYDAFARGVRRASKDVCIGGPALAGKCEFLDGFLKHVKETGIELEFVSIHYYSTNPAYLNKKIKPISISAMEEMHSKAEEIINNNGFEGIRVIVDEWGMSSAGYLNKEECPELMCRETERFSAYFVKLIRAFIDHNLNTESLMICLSGQHEMVEDFTGFRNFFTLNFIKKPIYNSYILASKLKENLLATKTDDDNLCVIATKDDNENYAVLMTYADDTCADTLPDISREIVFDETLKDKTATVWCIDKNTTNPYRVWEKDGFPEITGDVLKKLRKEGELAPIKTHSLSEPLVLDFSANTVYLITV